MNTRSCYKKIFYLTALLCITMSCGNIKRLFINKHRKPINEKTALIKYLKSRNYDLDLIGYLDYNEIWTLKYWDNLESLIVIYNECLADQTALISNCYNTNNIEDVCILVEGIESGNCSCRAVIGNALEVDQLIIDYYKPDTVPSHWKEYMTLDTIRFDYYDFIDEIRFLANDLHVTSKNLIVIPFTTQDYGRTLLKHDYKIWQSVHDCDLEKYQVIFLCMDKLE